MQSPKLLRIIFWGTRLALPNQRQYKLSGRLMDRYTTTLTKTATKNNLKV